MTVHFHNFRWAEVIRWLLLWRLWVSLICSLCFFFYREPSFIARSWLCPPTPPHTHTHTLASHYLHPILGHRWGENRDVRKRSIVSKLHVFLQQSTTHRESGETRQCVPKRCFLKIHTTCPGVTWYTTTTASFVRRCERIMWARGVA